MKQVYDVLIVGAGVVGSAVAREMARYELKIGVLEKNRDVCFETSGRNSAVIHGGFAYDIGTRKAECCVEGCLEFDQVAKELDIPFKRTGKVLVGNTPEDYESLLKTIEIGKINGSVGLEIIDEERLHALVPAAVGKFAMFSPLSGIVDPFHYTIALAENAKMNGVDFHFDHEVIGIHRDGKGIYTVKTVQGNFNTRWIVNCAGLGSVKISEMLGIHGYRFAGTKGDYLILDKRVGPLLPMPVYPVPSTTYMGIHVTPTVDGNVTVGPNADYVEDFTNYGVPQKNMDYLAEDASNLWPHIHKSDYIRNYSGIQPKWLDGEGAVKDFVIEAREEAPNTVNLIGIESPGLTSALPIARRAVKLLVEREMPSLNKTFNPNRKGIVRFSEQSDEEKARLIAENSDYGEIICRCETVTKAEILQAIHNPLGVDTMVGIKYRTRSMMGRCQGGYCQMRIAQMIQEELDKDVTNVLYARNGSNMFTGKVRE
ncbi:NAD(P)/FAD-dependent oxidoreductase [Geosporobacter ferrireducens]|uniref:FAD/NAD(P)-binding oxidoreductase n=1 Tax=Geosporobacter ferrireducens TaxID=1424294 RepID=A0A1D8GM42_9FIRM|nr:NAD(P)/FAD-dependent oxidoreductase [Geosporobacter ferrireducens]AOT71988.1 FAD/NAD(P)-binding oxidoreductase [Geosporobacter ferrireducens]